MTGPISQEWRPTPLRHGDVHSAAPFAVVTRNRFQALQPQIDESGWEGKSRTATVLSSGPGLTTPPASLRVTPTHYWRGVDRYLRTDYEKQHQPTRTTDEAPFTCNTCFTEDVPYKGRGNAKFCSCKDSICKACMKQAIKAQTSYTCPYKCGEPLFARDLSRVGISRKRADKLLAKIGAQRLLSRESWHACQDAKCYGGADAHKKPRNALLNCVVCKAPTQKKTLSREDRTLARVLVAGLVRNSAQDYSVTREALHCGIPTVKRNGCDNVKCAACDRAWNFSTGTGNGIRLERIFKDRAQYFVPKKGLLTDIGFYEGIPSGITDIPIPALIHAKHRMSPEKWLELLFSQYQEPPAARLEGTTPAPKGRRRCGQREVALPAIIATAVALLALSFHYTLEA